MFLSIINLSELLSNMSVMTFIKCYKPYTISYDTLTELVPFHEHYNKVLVEWPNAILFTASPFMFSSRVHTDINMWNRKVKVELHIIGYGHDLKTFIFTASLFLFRGLWLGNLLCMLGFIKRNWTNACSNICLL